MNWSDREYAIGRGIAAIRHRGNRQLQPLVRAVVEYSLPSLLQAATGSTFPNVSGPQLGAIPFPDLEPNVGLAISATLGALDDKIELNRQMNDTLESMARAIFKDWFVDFGPTRAKMEGRAPYLAPDLWALFPDRLDDEGKPEGWTLQRVDELFELAYGKSLPATQRRQGEFPVYGSGGITGYHDEALIPGPSIIVGRKGTIGTLYWEDRASFPIDTVFYVAPKASPSFCYYLLQTLGLEDMNTDAAVPGLNRNNVYRLTQALPSNGMMRTFDITVSALREQMRSLRIENEALTETRDLLLPKLMSGEIRVAEAKQ
jgi:type I restriction enzyme S subunit